MTKLFTSMCYIYIIFIFMLNKFAIPDHQNLPSYDMSTESERPLISDALVVLHSHVKHQ